MNEYIFDIEADSLQATKIHCLVAMDKEGNIYKYTKYQDMKSFLLKAICLVGHNIRRYDIPTLERILKIKITATLIDTLPIAWALEPSRNGHSLDSYGEEFGIPKPKIDDWENLSLEEYLHRCTEDVKINAHLWNKQWVYLKKLYSDEADIWRYCKYLSFKMYSAWLAEDSGWKLNVDYCTNALNELLQEKEKKTIALAGVMPKIAITAIRKPPAKYLKKDFSLTAKALEWEELLYSLKLPLDTKEVEVTTGYEEPNPGSTIQIKNWLISLGWKPRTFKYKDKREIPQINLEHGKGICDSIKELYHLEPNLELLDGLSVLTHRISILQGMINTVKDGYVTAHIQGLTNTLRFKHAHPLVNLPKTDKLYAKAIRTSLICEEDEELVGADKSGLEDRLKQHFIFPLDPDYVKTMMSEDYDPHLDIAVLAGMCTQEQSDAYKAGTDKSIKPVRDRAKNVNYSGQYGAGPPKMAQTGGFSLAEAKLLHKTYWDRNWAIKVVAEQQTVKTIEDQMWLYNPISGFWYSLRYEKDIFSTLVQGSASFVFDLWVMQVVTKRPQLTAQFHDEIVLTVKKGYREQITKFLEESINKTNEILKLNRELAIGIQFGSDYGSIH